MTSVIATRSMVVFAMLCGVSVTACITRGDVGENEPCLPSQSTCIVEGRLRCVDPTQDRAHCGSCNFVCADGDLCVQGRCASTRCTDGERACEGETALVCARDRTRFERRSCPRGTHCEGAGRCVDNVARWPERWMTLVRDEPSAQSGAPWVSWGGACGVRTVMMHHGEPAFVSTSDRTFHGRSVMWPTEGVWSVELRLRWHREATVLIMIGAYATVGESVSQSISMLQFVREVASVATVGVDPRMLSNRFATEQWHTIRFEAHGSSARMRWLVDGTTLIEQGLPSVEAFGPSLMIAGYGPCRDDVFAVGTVSLEEGAP